MKAQCGDMIKVRYSLWIENALIRSDVESEMLLSPGPMAARLVDSLIGLTVDEERTVEILASLQWRRGHYPEDIPEGSKLTFRFRLLEITRKSPDLAHPPNGSMIERMRRVESTLAEQYRQRSGEG